MNHARRIAAFALLTALTPLVVVAAGAETDAHRSVVNDGPVALSVSVDKSSAQVADPIQLVVEVRAPQGSRVELPRLPKELGAFEIRNSDVLREIPTSENPTQRVWQLRTTLETIKTGSLAIPSLDVHYATDGDSSTYKTLQSKPIEVQITSVLEDRADPTKFRDIKDTLDVPVPEQDSRAWVVWTAGSISVAAALALATVLVARRRRGVAPAAWALGQIEELEQLASEDSSAAESIYNELVDVVREFFELEFNVPTLSRTSREFLTEAVKTVGLGEMPRKRLAALMSLADQIKFARHGISEQQLRQALANARAFVEECDQHRDAMERMAG